MASADIVRRCLADDPAKRYADAAALADDLRRHIADRPLRGVRNRSVVEVWHKWNRRHPHVLLWTSILFALAAAPLAYIAHRPTPEPPTRFDESAVVYRANFDLGVNAYRAGRYADAAYAFGAAIAASPARAEAYYNRGLAYASVGDAAAARCDYDRALELDATLAAAALNRGVLNLREGRFAEARADLERALAADPATATTDLAVVGPAAGRPGGGVAARRSGVCPHARPCGGECIASAIAAVNTNPKILFGVGRRRTKLRCVSLKAANEVSGLTVSGGGDLRPHETS